LTFDRILLSAHEAVRDQRVKAIEHVHFGF